MDNVIKFPDEGRIVRFGGAEGAERSATIIILPVVRVERYEDTTAENVEPRTQPPTNTGGRRRVKRR